MKKDRTSIAKISRPKIANVYSRKRLFKALDSCGDRPVTWVSGPGGAGKTTLVASYLDSRKLPALWYYVDQEDADIATFFYYLGLAAKKAAPNYRKPMPLLTPEYLQGIAVFTRRYFEELFRRLKTPFVIVLDNYQEVPADSSFHEIIQAGLSQIPEGIRVIVMSRSEPPAAFIQMQANSKMHLLGWNDVRFTEDETKEIVRIQGGQKIAAEVLSLLHKKTEGWAAGLVLFLESARLKGFDYHSLEQLVPEEIFSYFADQIFLKADAETQAFLLKTSFLPSMTEEMSEALTGTGAAGRILSALSKRHFFTERHLREKPLYRYHPLFRDFLRAKAAGLFRRDEIIEIQKGAAALLIEAKQIEEAVILLRDAQDCDAYIRLVLGHAPALCMQGRFSTLREWLSSLPEDTRENTSWLLYWLGFCTLPIAPAESQVYFEKAFKLFEAEDDRTGLLSSWSRIVESIVFRFDDFKQVDTWIQWLDEKVDNGLSFPAPDLEAGVASDMTAVLLWRNPGHPKLKKWLSTALTLSEKGMHANTYLEACISGMYHYYVSGEFTECGKLNDEAEKIPSASPLQLIELSVVQSMLYCASASSHKKAVATIENGRELAAQTGVHMLDPILIFQLMTALMNAGDREAVRACLAQKEYQNNHRNCIQGSHFFYFSAWCSLLDGDLPAALTHAKKAVQLAAEAGVAFNETIMRLVQVQVQYAAGDFRAAYEQLALLGACAAQTGSRYFEYLYLLLDAYFALERKQERLAQESLRKAFSWAREAGYYAMTYFWRPDVMSRLCMKALESRIEADYARTLIQQLKLVPEEGAGELESWPWPVKIITLGKFEVLLNGKALIFSKKTQKKPLLLLKAVIALGGEDVQKEQLIDALWPDAEGDAGQIAFHTTISRLRKLIGKPAILLQGGKVSINRKYCWVDSFAFEQLYGRVATANKAEQVSSEVRTTAEQAAGLYKGAFLSFDTEQFFTISSRERTRSKYLQLVRGMGSSLEKSGDWQGAAAYYARGLDADPNAEEFYQGLIHCHLQLGRKTEAMAVYLQCKKVLRAALGVVPSEKTEALGAEILKA